MARKDHVEDLQLCAYLMIRLVNDVEKGKISYTQTINDIIKVRRELNAVRTAIEDNKFDMS